MVGSRERGREVPKKGMVPTVEVKVILDIYEGAGSSVKSVCVGEGGNLGFHGESGYQSRVKR